MLVGISGHPSVTAVAEAGLADLILDLKAVGLGVVKDLGPVREEEYTAPFGLVHILK